MVMISEYLSQCDATATKRWRASAPEVRPADDDDAPLDFNRAPQDLAEAAHDSASLL